jgi:putative thioredoxin
MSDSPYISEVTERDFDTLVAQKSREVPVLVDFWAAWCAPCQMLMPVLARLAGEYRGKFFLAKVNTDVEQALAARYGVRSLPTVKLFKNGAVVDEFLGAQPESTIRALLDRHIPRESDALVYRAVQEMRNGKPEQAVMLLQRARQDDPGNDNVKIELARVLLAIARHEEAAAVLDELSADAKRDPQAAALTARLEFARIVAAAPPVAELEKRIAADPRDNEARYQLAARRLLAGDYETALEQLLEIVRRDRRYGNGAAHKAMLKAFELLGDKPDLVRRYRGLLYGALN